MKKAVSILSFAALVIGVLFGIFFPELVPYIELPGVWYVNVLKVFISPVIFTSIAVTIYRTSKKKDRLVLKSVGLFSLMFLASFLLTSLLVLLIDPAKDFVFDGGSWSGQAMRFDFSTILKTLFPANLKEIFISPKVFAVILFAWIFGKLGSLIEKSKPVFDFLDKLKEWVFKALEYFMYLTPLAVFSLTAVTAGRYGKVLLGAGLRYIASAYICSMAVLTIVMMLPVFFIAKIGPLEYIKKVAKIWLMTFTTCSSSATLPYTVRVCRDEFGIDERVTDVVVPLGCTIHMCGGAVSFALLGLFFARVYGVSISFGAYMYMAVLALVINMAAPGIPGGGIVIGAGYLEMLGVPLDIMGFYSGIYKFLDMIYTTLNVTGDISANIILGRSSMKQEGKGSQQPTA
jgi:Na+/H+-dicarboxylate symporter